MRKTGLFACILAMCLTLAGYVFYVSAAEKSSKKPAGQEAASTAKTPAAKTEGKVQNAAVVNGTAISMADYDNEVARFDRQIAMTGRNPDLLEHDKFTDLLWAVCHLTEELEARSSFENLPRPDLNHLEGDIQRAFGLLIREWLAYMQHLRKNYPYIYSLSVRMNPFNPDSSPIIHGE